jgi:hypothetical protein
MSKTATQFLNCGSLEDAVVRANRERPSLRTRVLPREHGMGRTGHVVLGNGDDQAHA